jgi:hypothetical protein
MKRKDIMKLLEKKIEKRKEGRKEHLLFKKEWQRALFSIRYCRP